MRNRWVFRYTGGSASVGGGGWALTMAVAKEKVGTKLWSGGDTATKSTRWVFGVSPPTIESGSQQQFEIVDLASAWVPWQSGWEVSATGTSVSTELAAKTVHDITMTLSHARIATFSSTPERVLSLFW